MFMAKLEAFSLSKAPFQGRDAHRFVSKRSFEIQRTAASTYERYRTYPRAVKNIARLAISPEIESYIVREDGRNRMVGFATIIPNVSVQSEAGMIFSGSDLDYFLDDRVPEMMHESVAKALIAKNVLRAQREPDYDVMKTEHVLVTNNYPNRDRFGIPNRGLLDIVPTVTEVTRLTPVDNCAISIEVAQVDRDVILHHW